MAYAGPCPTPLTMGRTFNWSGRLFRGVGSALSKVETDPLPDLGSTPTIFVANHSSLADVFYAVAALSDWEFPARCLVRHTYFSNPFMGKWLRRVGMLPAGGGGTDAVTEAVEVLKSGYPIAIMPEGRIIAPDRRLGDGMGEFRDGFMTIARKAEAQIVPITIHGAEQVWPSRNKLPRLSLRRPKVRVSVGQPVQVDAKVDADVETEVRAQMAEMLARP